MSIATAPRRLSSIFLRKSVAYGYYGLKELARLFFKGDSRVCRHFVLYPAVNDAETLGDIVNRVSWYLPSSGSLKIRIDIVAGRQLLGTDLKSILPPASQHCYTGGKADIRLVGDRPGLGRCGAVLIWNGKSALDLEVIRHIHKADIVDPTGYLSLESTVYRRLYDRALTEGEKEKLRSLSMSNYRKFAAHGCGLRKGYVFCTGPSVESSFKYDFSDGIRVICNSIVNNGDLMAHIRPHLICFADPVFHFSPCLYAAEFRRLVLEAVKKYDCFVMVPDYNVALLLAHYPQLEERIIGMKVPGIWDSSILQTVKNYFLRLSGNRDRYNFPAEDSFYVAVANSILPLFMLPVASSQCEEIYIIGADGRRPGEKYFWKHSSKSQFTELMESAYRTHPGFFYDSLYDRNYTEYCEDVEKIVAMGESMGKKYISLTPSLVPALNKRLGRVLQYEQTRRQLKVQTEEP